MTNCEIVNMTKGTKFQHPSIHDFNGSDAEELLDRFRWICVDMQSKASLWFYEVKMPPDFPAETKLIKTSGVKVVTPVWYIS